MFLRHYPFSAALLATFVSLMADLSLAQTEIVGNNFAVTNVNVVPMNTDSVLERQTVIVVDGFIESIGDTASTAPPVDMKIVDGTDLFLMPGLADLHVHILHEDEFINYLAWGVTTVMHLGGSGVPGSELLEHRGRISSGELFGPNIFTTNRVFDGKPRLNERSLEVTDPETARHEVRNIRQQGFDFVKIYNNLAQAEFEAVVAEARKQDLAVIGHIPRKYDALESLAGGQNAVAHTEELFFSYFDGPRSTGEDMIRNYRPDMSRLAALVDVMIANDVATMPDLSFTFTDLIMWDDLDILWSDPDFPYLHPAIASMWERGGINRRSNIGNFVVREQWKYDLIRELTRQFQDAGILQVVGTDAALPGLYPGKAVHRELTELVKAGLSTYDALTIGTSNAGEFLRKFIDKDIRIGRIEPGYKADIVLLTDNPLEDIRNARTVVGVSVNGRYTARSGIDAKREALKSRYVFLRGANDAVDAALASGDPAANIAKLITANTDDQEYLSLVENRINAAGHSATVAGDLESAEEILVLNSELFAQSANTWDSLAELKLYKGDRDAAIDLYRRALEIDSDFRHAEEMIQKILSDSENE